MSNWSRRRFLQTVGTSFVAMPFVDWVFNPSVAEAQIANGPKNVVFFFHVNGGWFHHWEPKTSNVTTANAISTGDFTYNQIPLVEGSDALYRHHSLYPLIDQVSRASLSSDFSQKLMPVFGMEYKGYSNHAGGTSSALVGKVGNGSTGGKSIDYWLAERINKEWMAKKPLVLGVGANETSVPTDFVSYANSTQGNMPISNPYSAYRSVFNTNPVNDSTCSVAATANDGAAEPDPAAVAEANAASKKWLRQGRIIDSVKEEIQFMRGRLPVEQRKKLDDHLDSMNDLRKRIVPNADFEARRASSAACDEFLSQVRDNSGQVAPNACSYDNAVGSVPGYIDSIADKQIDLACNALGCGYTNVVTIQLFEGECQIVPTWLNTKETVHSLSHWTDNAYSNRSGSLTKLGKSALEMCDWYAWKFKRLLEGLEQKGILDDTLVVWATDMGDSQLHFNWNVPWLFAGATNTINAGKFVSLREGQQERSWEFDQVAARKCQSHGRVLNTIASMFGYDAQFRDDEGGNDAAIINEMLRNG